MFVGYHMSTYEFATEDPALRDQLVRDVSDQTLAWENTLGFSQQQKNHTLILSLISDSEETGEEKFTVFGLVPLDETHQSFSAIWEGQLSDTLTESVSLKLEQYGV